MTTPLSIRFDPGLLARLRRHAQAETGANTSALAQRLIDEGLRMAEDPGIVFKAGPSGRRAALAYGPDVREIVTVRDFGPIRLRTCRTGGEGAGLLFTSSRTFPRSRHKVSPLIEAIDAWLAKGPPAPPLTEDWLLNAEY